jgi:hypothetical protein
MKRILLRSRRSPFSVVDVKTVIRENAIGTNVGNLVFGHAAYKALDTGDVEIVVDGFAIDAGEADRINAEFDVYVVPLANAFRQSFEPQLIRMTQLIRRLTIPVVILGVGAQSDLQYRREPLAQLDESVRAFVGAVLDRAPSIGVRGAFTADYLASLGFRDVEVIGCPSMFFHGDRLPVEKRVASIEPESPLALNISPYVRALAPLVDRHVARHPNLIYVAQDLDTLALMVFGDRHPLDDGANGNPVNRAHRLFREDRVRFFTDPAPWLRFLQTRDFAFGSRIHGNIAALIAGTPAYVLAHDSRTLELAEYFQIPHRRVESGDDLSSVEAARLYEEVDYGPLVQGHPARFERYVAFLARHGLDHALDAARMTDFDARFHATPTPPAVHLNPATRRPRLSSLLRRWKKHPWVQRMYTVWVRRSS